MQSTVSLHLMRLPILAAFCCLGLTVVGCSSNQTAAQTNKGQVLGSISYAGPPAEYKIYYAPISVSGSDSRKNDFISVTTNREANGQTKVDLGDEFFNIDLKPGQYKFTSWEVSNGPTTVRPEEPFFVSFEVEPSGSVYVGNFKFEIPAGLDLAKGGVNVIYQDRLEQDMGKISDRYSAVDIATISRSLDDTFSMEWAAGSGESDNSLSLIIFSSF